MLRGQKILIFGVPGQKILIFGVLGTKILIFGVPGQKILIFGILGTILGREIQGRATAARESWTPLKH